MTLTGGCNPSDIIYSVDPATLTPPDICSTTATAYSVTVSATDGCSAAESCITTFDVAAYVDDLLLSACPDAQSFPTCSDQAAVTMAFNAWIAGLNAMTLTGGCNPSDIIYSVDPATLTPPDICSTTATAYSVTVSATDGCSAAESCITPLLM